jgi:hypothetical protein
VLVNSRFSASNVFRNPAIPVWFPAASYDALWISSWFVSVR